jgi:hypothetical protein
MDIESACKTLKARGVEFTSAPHMIFRPLALMEQVPPVNSPA